MQRIAALSKNVLPLCQIQAIGAKDKSEGLQKKEKTWTSIDRLNISLGLLHAMSAHALDNNIK